MKITLILLAAAAAVMAQSVDTVSATASGVCEPHDDHWHCPPGVAEPTAPPALLPSSAGSAAASITSAVSHSHDDDHDDHDHAATASTCEPHNDHWHCPSGVSKPATPPAQSATTSRASGSAAGASASPSASATPGAAAKVGSGFLAVAGAVGAWIL